MVRRSLFAAPLVAILALGCSGRPDREECLRFPQWGVSIPLDGSRGVAEPTEGEGPDHARYLRESAAGLRRTVAATTVPFHDARLAAAGDELLARYRDVADALDAAAAVEAAAGDMTAPRERMAAADRAADDVYSTVTAYCMGR